MLLASEVCHCQSLPQVGVYVFLGIAIACTMSRHNFTQNVVVVFVVAISDNVDVSSSWRRVRPSVAIDAVTRGGSTMISVIVGFVACGAVCPAKAWIGSGGCNKYHDNQSMELLCSLCCSSWSCMRSSVACDIVMAKTWLSCPSFSAVLLPVELPWGAEVQPVMLLSADRG